MITKVTPELLVDDIHQSITFYTDILGFKVTAAVPNKKDPIFIILHEQDTEIMLYQRQAFAEEIPHFRTLPKGGTVALYFEVDNVPTLYQQLQNKAKIIQALYQTNYGSHEFSCLDPNGYVLIFSQHGV